MRFMVKVVVLLAFSLISLSVLYATWKGYLPPRESILFTQPPPTLDSPVMSMTNGAKIVYGYLPYWTRTTARFPSALTHVSYFSLTIQSDGALLDIPKEKQDPGYRAYVNGVLPWLRTQLNSSQKAELTLTMMDQDEIPTFLRDSKAHQKLVGDIQAILDSSPIDGLNIDIEYNGIVDASLQDSFSSLIRMIRQATQEKNKDFLLTLAIYGDSGQIERVTKIGDLAPYVDYFIVMAYDYHRRVSPRSGPVSPLYGKAEGMWEADILNDLKKITDQAPSEKILLGVPFYGYEWSVEDASDPQSFTLPKSGLTATYQRIQSLLSSSLTTQFWDDTALSPYLQYSKDGITQRIYFEDSRSLSYKLRLVNQAGLGGIAIWALGYEGQHQGLWNTIEQTL